LEYVTLYRKYRPRVFAKIIGQYHVTKTLVNALKANKTSHAYLFAGPRGTGKTSTAKVLAKALNCQNKTTDSIEPCNSCLSCENINKSSSVDVLEIDAASNRGIDEIRNLRERVYFTPSQGTKKVFIIDEVHMLTKEAFNALLKMIEEPPNHAVFILATTEIHKVIPTIVSRCQRFDFRRIRVTAIVACLKEIAHQEEISVEESTLAVIARQAQGSVRDSIGLLDQLASFSDKKITPKALSEVLNLTESEILFELTDLIVKKDTLKCLEFIDSLMDRGFDLRQFTSEMIGHFRSIAIAITTDKPADIIHTTPENLNRLKDQAKRFEVFEALKAIDLLSETYRQMRYSGDIRLLLEIALIRLTKLEADISVEGLLYRIEELEKKVGSKSKAGKPSAKNEVEQIPPQPSIDLKKKETGEKESADWVKKEKQQAVKVEVEKAGAKNQEKEKERAALHDKKKDDKSRVGEKIKISEKPTMDTAKLRRAWPIVMQKIKEASIPLYSLMLECHLSKKDSGITLVFNKGANFHLKEVSKDFNVALVKKAIKSAIGSEVDIECELQDLESAQKKTEKINANLSANHVIKMMQDSFGAEIIEKTTITKDEDE